MAANAVTEMIYNRYNHLLTDLDQFWLSPQNRQGYACAIGAAATVVLLLTIVDKEWSIVATKEYMPFNLKPLLPLVG